MVDRNHPPWTAHNVSPLLLHSTICLATFLATSLSVFETSRPHLHERFRSVTYPAMKFMPRNVFVAVAVARSRTDFLSQLLRQQKNARRVDYIVQRFVQSMWQQNYETSCKKEKKNCHDMSNDPTSSCSFNTHRFKIKAISLTETSRARGPMNLRKF